jgi:hypothetical protein
MSRFYWECDLIGYRYDRTLREDCEVRIHDREKRDRVVHRITLPQVTFHESREQAARVLDLFLLTQQENQP